MLHASPMHQGVDTSVSGTGVAGCKASKAPCTEISQWWWAAGGQLPDFLHQLNPECGGILE